MAGRNFDGLYLKNELVIELLVFLKVDSISDKKKKLFRSHPSHLRSLSGRGDAAKLMN